MKNFFSATIPFLLVMSACSHGTCNSTLAQKKNSTTVAVPLKEHPMPPAAKSERVKVYKEDGSLQCGQGKAVSIAEMQSELRGIQVYSAENKNDGMMRIQVCGSPTGRNNVYEIDRKDLPAALKVGFKEWTFE